MSLSEQAARLLLILAVACAIPAGLAGALSIFVGLLASVAPYANPLYALLGWVVPVLICAVLLALLILAVASYRSKTLGRSMILSIISISINLAISLLLFTESGRDILRHLMT